MSLWNKYNNEDILVRAVIAGLLDTLNHGIKYDQVWSNTDIETIEVPWYYDQSGDERFMQDFYTMYAQCGPPRPVDGNFDKIPRGVISYSGSQIVDQRITSRFVQGQYVKEVDGKLQQFVSYLFSIPLQVNFEAELWIDTWTSALKIEQALRETLYKNVTFYVYYKGLKLGCTAGFPVQANLERKVPHAFEEDQKIKMRFNIEVEAYQPVFDPTTEMLAGNNMKGFAYRLYEIDEKSDGAIRATSPTEGAIIPKGTPIWLEWVFSDEGAVINRINTYWLNYGENERFDIELNVPNNEFYIWNIPDDFTQYKYPDIIWEEDSSINIIKDPLIKVIPDLNTNEITDMSFYVIEEGYFFTEDADSSIGIQLEMTADDGTKHYSPDGAIWVNVTYNKINPNIPVWVNPDVSIFFPGTVDYKRINIHIANAVNTDVFGIAHDIKIV